MKFSKIMSAGEEIRYTLHFSFLLKKLYNLCSVKIQTVETGTQRNPCTQVPVPCSETLRIILEMFCPCINVFIITKRKKKKKTRAPNTLFHSMLLETTISRVYFSMHPHRLSRALCFKGLLFGLPGCLWVKTWIVLQYLTQGGKQSGNIFHVIQEIQSC